MTKRLLIRSAYIIEETMPQRPFVSIHSHVATPTPLNIIIDLFSGRDRRASLSFRLRDY